MIIDDLQCGQSFTGMMNVATNYSISIPAEERTVERSKCESEGQMFPGTGK